MSARLERRIANLRVIVEKSPDPQVVEQAKGMLQKAEADLAAENAKPVEPGLLERTVDAVAGPARQAWNSANAAADRFLDTASMGVYGQLSEAASRLPVVGEALAGKPGALALQREKWQTENPSASALGTAAGLVAGAAAGPARLAQGAAEAGMQMAGRALPAAARAAAAQLPRTSKIVAQGGANAAANVPVALSESRGDSQAAVDSAAMGALFPFLAAGLAPAGKLAEAGRNALANRTPTAARYVDARESGMYRQPGLRDKIDEAVSAIPGVGKTIVPPVPQPVPEGFVGPILPPLPGRTAQAGAGLVDYSGAGNSLLGRGPNSSGTKKLAAIAEQTELERLAKMNDELSPITQARGRNAQALETTAPLPFPQAAADDLEAVAAAQKFSGGDDPAMNLAETRAKTQKLARKAAEFVRGTPTEAQRALPVRGRETTYLPTLRDAGKPPVPPRRAYELAAPDLPEGLPPMKGVGTYVTQDGKTMLLPRADLQFPGRDDVAMSMRPDVPQGTSLLGFRPGPVELTGDRAPRTFGDVHSYVDKDLREAANAVDSAGKATPDALAAQAVRGPLKQRMYDAAPEIEMRQPLFDEQGNRYLGEATGEKVSIRDTQADVANEIAAQQAQNRLIYGRPGGPKKYDGGRSPGDLEGDIPQITDANDQRKALEFWMRRGNAGAPGTTADIGFRQLEADPRLGSLIDVHDARLARAAMSPGNAGLIRENLTELAGSLGPVGQFLKARSMPVSAGAQIGLLRMAEMPGAAQVMPTTALVPPFLDIESAYQAAIERQRKDRQP
jgi:hypothetical protein